MWPLLSYRLDWPFDSHVPLSMYNLGVVGKIRLFVALLLLLSLSFFLKKAVLDFFPFFATSP